MADKPGYLGLLNAIAVNEARAQRYLAVWIDTTPDPEVAAVLRMVAWREGEHGASFARRINELGFEVRERPDPVFEEQLEVAGSARSDLEKMRFFGLDRLDDLLHGFDGVFGDHSIDIRTGELLGRYIAEEFDTARVLRACHDRLAAASPQRHPDDHPGHGPDGRGEAGADGVGGRRTTTPVAGAT